MAPRTGFWSKRRLLFQKRMVAVVGCLAAAWRCRASVSFLNLRHAPAARVQLGQLGQLGPGRGASMLLLTALGCALTLAKPAALHCRLVSRRNGERLRGREEASAWPRDELLTRSSPCLPALSVSLPSTLLPPPPQANDQQCRNHGPSSAAMARPAQLGPLSAQRGEGLVEEDSSDGRLF